MARLYANEDFPSSFQVGVLDFVEHLLAKAERELGRQEGRDWSNLSLSFAMRGMEDEDTPPYITSDLQGGVLMRQAGQIVLFGFPRADLEERKLRPALLLGRLAGECDNWFMGGCDDPQ
jgi:hypothetical protein